jgi:hypothetical protein
VEVTGAAVGARDVERSDTLGFDVYHAVLILERALDKQKAAAGDEHAVAFEDVWGEDDVGDAGFVFEGEKDESLRRSWALAGELANRHRRIITF